MRAEERSEREKLVQIAEEAMKAAEACARHMVVRRREACNKLQEASGAISGCFAALDPSQRRKLATRGSLP